MVDAGGEDDQIPDIHRDPDPLFVVLPHVEVPGAAQDEPNLFVCVKVLLVKRLELSRKENAKYTFTTGTSALEGSGLWRALMSKVLVMRFHTSFTQSFVNDFQPP